MESRAFDWPLRCTRLFRLMKNIAAFGLYRTKSEIEDALEALKEAGFRNTDISVLMPENAGTRDLGDEKHTKAPEGAVAGAASGAVLGGALGWLAGIGALAIPGIGPFLAAGPIIAALAGVGAAGAIGGVSGALVGSGMPEYEAKRYEGRLKHGGILLSVHCDSKEWVSRAKAVLMRTGAEDVASSSEAAADYGASDKPMPRTRTSI